MLFKPKALFWLAAVIAALNLAGCARDPMLEVVEVTARDSILPLHRNFAESADALSDASRQFCRQPTDSGLESLRQQWRSTVSTWSGIQFFQMGPITEDNRSWRLQFWPDLKDQTARRLVQLLNSDKPISVEQIHQSPVIIQGLSALEVLLFDTRWGQLDNYAGERPLAARQCQLLQAIARNSADVADAIWQGWQAEGGNYIGQLSHPGDDNLQYPDNASALAAIVDTLVFTVEQVKVKKLNRALGLDGSAPGNPYRLEWWRSDDARLAIDANLQAMQALYRAGEAQGLDHYLRNLPEGAPLAEDIRDAMARSREQLAAIDVPLSTLAKSGDRPQALQQLYSTLQTLEQLLAVSLPAKLNITLSFNANDGD